MILRWGDKFLLFITTVSCNKNYSKSPFSNTNYNSVEIATHSLEVSRLPGISEAIYSRYRHGCAGIRIMVSVKSFTSLTLKAHFVNNGVLSEIPPLLLILPQQCATLDNLKGATQQVHRTNRSVSFLLSVLII